MNLSDTWAALEAMPEPGGAALLMRSSLDGRHSAVAAGLRFPGRERVLILRLEAAQARVLLRRGLTGAIKLTRLPDDPIFTGQGNIELASAERRYQDLFALIGGDLIAQLADDPVNAGQVMLARLHLWRGFLYRREDGDEERWARGLFGELWYLQHHVLRHRAPTAALGCWLGPAGATHDFELGAFALDVKTGAVGSETVHISSLQQLTPSPGSQLLLAHLRLRRDAQGSTLRELVASVRTGLPPGARPVFDSRLLAAGYVEEDSGAQDELRLAAQDLRVFHVAPGFPALTLTSVPAGVEQCAYTINLAQCRNFQVSPDVAWSNLVERSQHS